MPTWGWITVGALLILLGRAKRAAGGATVGVPSSPEEAAGDLGDGAMGVWGEVTDALGAPLKDSLYQAERTGVPNGPRNTLAR